MPCCPSCVVAVCPVQSRQRQAISLPQNARRATRSGMRTFNSVRRGCYGTPSARLPPSRGGVPTSRPTPLSAPTRPTAPGTWQHPCRRQCTASPTLYARRAEPSRAAASLARVRPRRRSDGRWRWRPPFTFTRSVSQPRSLLTAQAWAANASFASIRSRSSVFQPARLSAFRLAGIGPVPITAGSTPAVANEAMRASGVRPRAGPPPPPSSPPGQLHRR